MPGATAAAAASPVVHVCPFRPSAPESSLCLQQIGATDAISCQRAQQADAPSLSSFHVFMLPASSREGGGGGGDSAGGPGGSRWPVQLPCRAGGACRREIISCFYGSMTLKEGLVLVSLWFSPGFPLDQFWFCSRPVLVLFWTSPGLPLVQSWFPFCPVLVLFWTCPGFPLFQSWSSLLPAVGLECPANIQLTFF